MLSPAPLRPARPASSIANSTSILPAGVGSVSPSHKRAARETMSIIVALAKTSTPSSSSSSKTSKRSSVIAAAAPSSKKAAPPKKKGSGKEQQQIPVDYGRDWFAATRDPSRGLSPRQEMERRREANRAANNGLERKDLYTDAWAGSEYRGSSNNIVRFSFLAGRWSGSGKRRFRWRKERKKEETKHTTSTPPPRKRKTKTKKQLTWLIVASVAAPALGLLFAWQTYGTLWG